MKRILFPLLFLVQHAVAQETVKNSLGMEFRLVPAGHFVMGENHQRKSARQVFAKDHLVHNIKGDSGPAHPAFITRPFYLAAHEVTVSQFAQFAKGTGYVTTAEKSGDGIVGWGGEASEENDRWRRMRRDAGFTWKNPGFEQKPDHPVVGVSWEDAQAFCKWLGEKEGLEYRLPTEAEWEYASRAKSEGFFCFGDDYRSKLHQYANHADATLEAAHKKAAALFWYVGDKTDGAFFTSPVGKFRPNAWGMHDMHGNAWEWCADLYHENYYARYHKTTPDAPVRSRAVNPVNLDEPWNDFGNWRTIRGGAWNTSPERCRSNRRAFFEQADGACYIGFRVARDAQDELVEEAEADYAKQEQARAAITQMPGTKWGKAFGRDLSLLLEVFNPDPKLKNLLPLVPRITRLRINAGGGEFSPELLQAIASMPQLRALQIDQPGKRVPPEAYLLLAGLPNLEVLIFAGGASITPVQLKQFVSLPNLTDLYIENPDMNSGQVLALKGIQFPKLVNLNLHSPKCDGTGIAVFEGAPLQQLGLHSLSDEGAAVLRKFPGIQTLLVYQPKLTAQGLKDLSGLQRVGFLELGQLKQLADKEFVPLQQMQGLRKLGLNGSGAGDAAAAAIANLPLRSLTIGSPALTDKGMRRIGGITTLNESLEIGPTAKVTDAGLKHLWGPNRLWQLVLRQKEGITGAGFSTLAHELEGLRIVKVASVDLTDEGLQYLGLLPMLEEVELGHYQAGFPPAVSDVGLAALAEAPKLKKVRLKSGDNRGITPAGIAKMKERHPNLEVQEW